MKRAVLLSTGDIGGGYAFDISRSRFDGRNDRHLDYRIFGVVCLQLITGLDPAALVRGVKLYEDGANLTRLNDFLKVKVAYLASAGRGARS
jgi:hypothetical protein